MTTLTSEQLSLKTNYAQMMAMPAWKDLVGYAEDERVLSIKKVDDRAAADLNLNTVCEERGIRIGMRKLMHHADQRLEGI